MQTPGPGLQLLEDIFRRNAYIRVPNEQRRQELRERYKKGESRTKYKKGYEVRFAVKTAEELDALRELLLKAGFSPARPFQKAKQIVQPIYGKQAVDYFRQFRGVTPPVKRRRRSSRRRAS